MYGYELGTCIVCGEYKLIDTLIRTCEGCKLGGMFMNYEQEHNILTRDVPNHSGCGCYFINNEGWLEAVGDNNSSYVEWVKSYPDAASQLKEKRDHYDSKIDELRREISEHANNKDYNYNSGVHIVYADKGYAEHSKRDQAEQLVVMHQDTVKQLDVQIANIEHYKELSHLRDPNAKPHNTTYETNYDKGHDQGRSIWQEEQIKINNRGREQLMDPDFTVKGDRIVAVMEAQKFSFQTLEDNMIKHLDELRKEGRLDITKQEQVDMVKQQIRDVQQDRREVTDMAHEIKSHGMENENFHLNPQQPYATMHKSLTDQVQEKTQSIDRTQQHGIER